MLTKGEPSPRRARGCARAGASTGASWHWALGLQSSQGDPGALRGWDGSGWGALGSPGSFSASAVEHGMELLGRTWCQGHSGVVVVPGTTLMPTAAALSWGFPHPWGWIQPQDVFLPLCPASRQECAGSSSLCAGHAWHPSHTPLGIPHTPGLLVMPLAWALPSALSMGLGTSSWGLISQF